MMPSTACLASRSRAARTEVAVSAVRLSMVTTNPASRAACSMPNRVLAGPYSVLLKVITPSVCERRVTSARAAELGR